MNDCGGCAGTGRHRRWCPVAVGEVASILGEASEAIEDLGDQIGNNARLANRAYALAGRLDREAKRRKARP